jgi:hypothetical protein
LQDEVRQEFRDAVEDGRLIVIEDRYDPPAPPPQPYVPIKPGDYPPTLRELDEAKSWIRVKLVDQEGTPIANERVEAKSQKTPDSWNQSLDSTGRLIIKSVDPGQYNISFPDLDAKEWDAASDDNMDGDMYQVQAGDHLASIADRFGFRCMGTVWKHPKNAELRKSRDNPHVLQEGDKLFVPKKRQMSVSRPTGMENQFVVQRTLVTLNVKLLDAMGQPLASLAGTVDYGQGPQDVTTDGNGMLKTQVPASCKTVTISIPDANLICTLGAGQLDPEDESAGPCERLDNMGYVADDSDDASSDAESPDNTGAGDEGGPDASSTPDTTSGDEGEDSDDAVLVHRL